MNYREKGYEFCNEVNNILKSLEFPTALVTGGGFAYDSIKYKNDEKRGDYDYMIVFEDKEHIETIIKELTSSNFSFETNYLNLDIELLLNGDIDIIRLSGNYLGTKSTINLVPISLINKLCNLESDITIRKIAHNRNTGLFFAYGSDNDRIIVNFLSSSFVTTDGEDHYIHLDFSNKVIDGNIYFGILSDAILKGFNDNYDTIGFGYKRKQMIQKINAFFGKHHIDNSLYLNLFANNNYFPIYLKEQLQNEFDSFGINKYSIKTTLLSKPPIIVTSSNITSYPSNPFNFVNNKKVKGNFLEYIKLMQNSEYDRQYLIDALAKFFGYILFNNKNSLVEYNKDTLITDMSVYGNNDLFVENIKKYSIESIFKQLIKELKKYKSEFNPILYKEYLLMTINFLSVYLNVEINTIALKYNVDLDELLSKPLDRKMNIDVVEQLDSFEDIGMYHNYTSSVMPIYSKTECDFLEGLFSEKSAFVLDVMCGYGRIANELANRNYLNLYGVDLENYDFLKVDKDFRFIQSDIFKFNPNILFDYLYSFYNCYSSKEDLKRLLDKLRSISSNEAIIALDIFNKEWRDSIEEKFYKLLFDEKDKKLEIFREYDSKSGIETTKYVKSNFNGLKDIYEFSQKFFTKEEIIDLTTGFRDYDIVSSFDVNSRKNNQKHILVLKR